jgi:hypothetical protein
VNVVYFWDKEGFPGISQFSASNGISAQQLLPPSNIDQRPGKITRIRQFHWATTLCTLCLVSPIQHGGKVIGVLTAQAIKPTLTPKKTNVP